MTKSYFVETAFVSFPRYNLNFAFPSPRVCFCVCHINYAVTCPASLLRGSSSRIVLVSVRMRLALSACLPAHSSTTVDLDRGSLTSSINVTQPIQWPMVFHPPPSEHLLIHLPRYDLYSFGGVNCPKCVRSTCFCGTEIQRHHRRRHRRHRRHPRARRLLLRLLVRQSFKVTRECWNFSSMVYVANWQPCRPSVAFERRARALYALKSPFAAAAAAARPRPPSECRRL